MELILNPIRIDIADIRRDLYDLRVDLAIVNNRASLLPTHPIMPIPRIPPAPLPASFPRTMTELRTLLGGQLDECLTYYNLQLGGTAVVKKNRLAVHLGAALV
jgi:hypothetical protein